MKLRFVILFALLAVLVGASVGGSDRAEAQFGGSPLPGFPPGVFDNRAALAGPSGGGYQGPGDIVGSATAFYSCARAYNAAYATATGNLCIIADAATGNTSTCTLVAATTGFVNLTGTYCGGSTPAAFCTAHTSCVVTHMYDQSGALACASSTNCDLVQATLADMPALTFSALNSLPCLTSAANQSMTSTNPLTISQPWTFTAVAERTGSFTTENDLIGNNGGGVNSFFTPATGHVELYILGGSTTVVAADSAFHGLQFIAGNGSASTINVDGTGTAVGTLSTAAWSNQPVSLGVSDALIGHLCEASIYGIGFSSGQQTTWFSNANGSSGYNGGL